MKLIKAIAITAIVLTSTLNGVANASNYAGDVGAPQHTPDQIAWCTAVMGMAATVRPDREYHLAYSQFTSIIESDIRAGRFTNKMLESTKNSVTNLMAHKDAKIVPMVNICVEKSREIRVGGLKR